MHFAILCDRPHSHPWPTSRTPASEAARPPITRHARHVPPVPSRPGVPAGPPAHPPNRCYAHLLGTVAVAMASGSSRHPSPRPAHPAGSARERFAHIHRDFASVRCCAAVEQRACSCFCFNLLPACPAADLAVADSPPSARRRPARVGPVADRRADHVLVIGP